MPDKHSESNIDVLKKLKYILKYKEIINWNFAGNTAVFGHSINDGRPFWIGDFNGDGRDDVLFYYPGDDNWWLGSYDGSIINWNFAGNTASGAFKA
jgi:hypothetical protein